MIAIARAARAIAAVLVREGIDYAQSRAVFKAAQARAGLRAAPGRGGGIDQRTAEELDSFDQAYALVGRSQLTQQVLLQLLLETQAQLPELVQIRVEDVNLAACVVTIKPGKGGKRRELLIQRDLAQVLRRHIGARQTGPLFASRYQDSSVMPQSLPQRVDQVIREMTRERRS